MEIATMWLQYHPVLLKYLRRYTRSMAEAEDLAQATFVKAMENVDKLMAMDAEHAKAWLLRTAHNAFIDEVRRQKRQAPWQDAAQPVYEEDFSGVYVAQLMDALPPNLREVVRLRHLEGHNSPQIGQMLNLPPATVRTRLRAAMILLEQYKEKEME